MWRGRSMAARVALCLVLVELLSTIGDLLLGPWARTHWEELFNARAGVQFACGHLDRAWEMQYRTFCGGCTAEGVLAVPLYVLLGPTVLAWKAVPAIVPEARCASPRRPGARRGGQGDAGPQIPSRLQVL